MKKALFLGILSSFFFAFTFILNRSMNLGGGYWMWNAPLRYFITLPIMALLIWTKSGCKSVQLIAVLDAIKKNPFKWILWSTIGFGVFYLPLTFASTLGESWMTAAAWEITIVAGVLLTPLDGKKIPVKNVFLSSIIVVGVFVMQIPNIQNKNIMGNLIALGFILVAAFAYPLGNRKMMKVCPVGLDTMQRILGMLLCSTPFWMITGLCAFITGGAPSSGQLVQSCGVALFSGVIATTLFFSATGIVKDNPKHLAVIEATQCGEVIFTLLGGVLILGDSLPTAWGYIGIGLVVIGMVLNSLV